MTVGSSSGDVGPTSGVLLLKNKVDSLPDYPEVVDILNRTGMSGLIDMCEYTYKFPTLEFFSSFNFLHRDELDAMSVRFCLFNTYLSYIIAAFGAFLGLHIEGSKVAPRGLVEPM
ncbi:hypothetical protein KSS87_021227 [Heliosperma pusillum]|nr:hypothetical protein KSS87_021227 [Heliosperma pusillum]